MSAVTHTDVSKQQRERRRRAKGQSAQSRKLHHGTCNASGKRKFESAIDVLIEHATNPRKIKAYQCPHCGAFHAATAH